MTLRMAGEEAGIVQGLDSSGWLKDIVRNTSDYGVKITQNGAGLSLDLASAASSARALGLGGDALLYRSAAQEVAAEKTVRVQKASGDEGKYLRFLLGTNEQSFLGKRSGLDQVELNGVDLISHDGHIQVSPGPTHSLILTRPVDLSNYDLNNANNVQVKGRLSNPGSGDGGWLTVGDSMKVVGDLDVHPDDVSGAATVTRASLKALGLKERTTHLADTDVPEDYGLLYVFNGGGGTRQLVMKYKDAGTTYTGTLALT